jgi:hypothetical protein
VSVPPAAPAVPEVEVPDVEVPDVAAPPDDPVELEPDIEPPLLLLAFVKMNDGVLPEVDCDPDVLVSVFRVVPLVPVVPLSARCRQPVTVTVPL